MNVVQTTTFAKAAKKLYPGQKKELDQAIRAVMAAPTIADMKSGDLSGLRVHKFKMNKQLALLAYDYEKKNDRLILLALGSHENFYRDLKKSK